MQGWCPSGRGRPREAQPRAGPAGRLSSVTGSAAAQGARAARGLPTSACQQEARGRQPEGERRLANGPAEPGEPRLPDGSVSSLAWRSLFPARESLAGSDLHAEDTSQLPGRWTEEISEEAVPTGSTKGGKGMEALPRSPKKIRDGAVQEQRAAPVTPPFPGG